MKTAHLDEEYKYVIDEDDNIIYVNGKKWDEFYKDNSSSHNCLSSNIMKQSLFSFIDDFETRHLYEDILKTVREYKKEISFPFRCDSSKQRRFLKLIVKPYGNNHIEFVSKIIKVEDRDYVSLLDFKTQRTQEFLKICSMCKKIKVDDNIWEEVETAIKVLGLFQRDILPKLNHGLCPFCLKLYEAQMAEFIKEAKK